MALLDQIIGTPSDQALFALGSGLLGVRRGNEGRAFQQAMSAYNDAKERDDVKKQRELQQKLLEMQLKGQQQTMDDAAAYRAAFADPSALMRSKQSAFPPNEMDPEGSPASRPEFDPRLLQQALFNTRNPAAIKEAIGMMTKQDALHKLGPGDSLWSEARGMVASAPPKPEESPVAKLIREAQQFPVGSPMRKIYDDAIAKATTHQPAVNVSYGSPVAGVDPSDPTKQVFFRPDNRGGMTPTTVRPPPTGADRPPTEFESKAGLYATSMRNASLVLNDIENRGKSDVGLAEVLPGNETTKNIVRARDRQQYVQAQRQWIDSINRVRSGANLPEIEYNRAVLTFFPQYGDTPLTIEQKRKMRTKEEAAMVDAAGRASARVPGATPAQAGSDNPTAAELVEKYRSR